MLDLGGGKRGLQCMAGTNVLAQQRLGPWRGTLPEDVVFVTVSFATSSFGIFG